MDCLETCPYRDTIQELKQKAEENIRDHERIRNENIETKFLVKDVQADVKYIIQNQEKISNNQEKLASDQDKFTESIKKSVADIKEDLNQKINEIVLAPVKRREKILIGITIACAGTCFSVILTLIISLLK